MSSDGHTCRLYLVTPPRIDLKKFPQQLHAAFSGGDVASLQLRLKGASDDEILEAADILLPICREHHAAFMMNDSAELCAQARADGVHLGQDDMGVGEARKIIGPDRIIGMSAHASRHMAMEAGDQGADYVAFGAFYPTTSKPKEKIEKWGTPSPEILSWWSETTVLPCVAIGGINPGNCEPLVQAGADFIAAITAVWDHPEGPATAVKEFNAAIKRATSGKKL